MARPLASPDHDIWSAGNSLCRNTSVYRLEISPISKIASNATPGSIEGRIRNGNALAGEPDGASGSTGIVIASP